MSKLRIGFAAGLVLALTAPAASLAEESVVTWIIEYTADAGRGSELVDQIKDFWGDATQAQIDAGNVMAWGIAEAANYSGGPTHVEWINYPDWEAAARAEEVWQETLEETSASGKSALRRAMSDLLASRPTEGVSRSVFRTYAGNLTDFRYFVLGEYFAKPGRSSTATRLWLDEVKPVYERLMSDGTINGFGLAVPALDSGDWTHYTWFGIDGLGSMGKVQAAIGEIVDEEMERQIAEIFDTSKHTDTLYRVLHLSGPQAD